MWSEYLSYYCVNLPPPSNIPISENSDLDLLCFKPEENENMSEAFITSIKDS